MVIFIVIAASIFCVLGGVHHYLWRRLVRDVSAPRGAYRRIGTVLVFLLPALTIAAQVSGRAEAPFTLQQILAWPGFFWFALLIYLLMSLLVLEPLRPLVRRLLEGRDAGRSAVRAESAQSGSVDGSTVTAAQDSRPAAGGSGTATGTGTGTATAVDTAPAKPVPAPGRAGPAQPSRRLFVARAAAMTAGVVATGTVGYGAYGQMIAGPELKRVRIPLAKLPRGADGYRIAVVSDIHLGPILGRSHTRRIVDLINKTSPDMVAVVGDLTDGPVADLAPAAEPLAQLSARDGSYFVTGNHEYFSGAQEWIEHVRELGLRPMRNEREELRHFDLAGVNDLAGEDEGDGPDFDKALGDRDTARASVLLAHQPVQIHDAVGHGVDLQLSGHTHGGQMWPGHILAGLANPTLAGVERYGDTQLYVTRGAGAWGPPVRVGAEAEVTVVELASTRA